MQKWLGFGGLWLSGLVASFWCGPAWADGTAARDAGAENRSAFITRALSFEKYQLRNGLTVILHRDPSLPLVAVNVWYHVGPAYEPARRSGFAHLFEHLMFDGSKHVGREFDRLLEAAGATNVNGTTEFDRTSYFATVPREKLELLLWIESDRMGFMLDSLTQGRLDTEREVVRNERRQTFENAPYGPSLLTLMNGLFPAGHPYNGAVIGSMEDLGRATLDDVKNFFTSYYAPSNATLALAGDFDPELVRRWVAKYFETLPDRPRPAKRPLPNVAVAAGRRVVQEPVELGQVSMGWRTPPAFTPDEAPLQVASAILLGGRSSRFFRKLVIEDKLASDVSGAFEPYQLAGTLTLFASAASSTPLEKLEQAVDPILAHLAAKGPTAEELRRAKRRTTFHVLNSLQLLNGPDGASGRAGILQYLNHYLGDPGYLPTWLRDIERVSAADVARVVGTHLVQAPRVTVVTQPEQDSP